MARTLEAQRRAAAEEVCWALVVMMGLGGLEIPMEWRKYLGNVMDPWVELAVQTGKMKGTDDEQQAQG